LVFNLMQSAVSDMLHLISIFILLMYMMYVCKDVCMYVLSYNVITSACFALYDFMTINNMHVIIYKFR
jgi:hypothetical protein